MNHSLFAPRIQRAGRLLLLLLFLIALGSVATRNVQAGLSCELHCPTVSPVGNDTGDCGAKVTYPPPTEFGDCVGVGCSPPSGSFFPVGTTTVNCMRGATFTGITPSGGSSCFFFVTVNDTQPPMITCPANIKAAADPSGSGQAIVNYPLPTVADNCPGVGTPTCNPPSGSSFLLGTTTVNCSVTDAHMNQGLCSFSVTVKTCVITCPANITVGNDAGQCSAVVNYPPPTTSAPPPTANGPSPTNGGSCGTVICTPPAGSTFPVGTTTVTCDVFDVGVRGIGINANPSIDTCSFTITVNDTEGPIITCPANVTAECTGGLTQVMFDAPVASDNCASHGGTTVFCLPPSSSGFRLGSSNVVCYAVDVHFLTNSCSFSVTVEDTSPPTVTCPADKTVTESSPGSGSAVVTYIALASDPCGLASFNCAPVSGSTFTIGSTEVTCTATNSSGLGASCSFDVTVVGACIIICPANINAIGVGSANVTYPAPTTTNCGTATVVCTPSSGSSFPVGTTTVTCETEFDGAGPSCSFAVTVISPCDAIEAIVLALDAGGVSRKDSKPLIASLKAACASFERESIGSGINQLQAFQNKVQSQIAPTNPTLAALLIAMAQAIIDAVSP